MTKPAGKTGAKFVQLTSAKGMLYALDDDGFVWMYKPKERDPDGRETYARWVELTQSRVSYAKDRRGGDGRFAVYTGRVEEDPEGN